MGCCCKLTYQPTCYHSCTRVSLHINLLGFWGRITNLAFLVRLACRSIFRLNFKSRIDLRLSLNLRLNFKLLGYVYTCINNLTLLLGTNIRYKVVLGVLQRYQKSQKTMLTTTLLKRFKAAEICIFSTKKIAFMHEIILILPKTIR